MIKRFEEYESGLEPNIDGEYCLYSDYYLLEKEYKQIQNEYISLIHAHEILKSSLRLPPDHDIIP